MDVWVLQDSTEYLFAYPLVFASDELVYEFLSSRFLPGVEKTEKYWEDHWEENRSDIRDEHARNCCEQLTVIEVPVHSFVPQWLSS